MGRKQRKAARQGKETREKAAAPYPWRYWLLCLVAACQLATILISWSAWNVREHPVNLPLVPLPQFSFGPLLLISLAAILVRPREGLLAHTVLYAASCLFDQHRFQPQVISLIVLLAACVEQEGTWFARWYLAAMWLWSGLHKLLSPEWLGWGSWTFLEGCGIKTDGWHFYFAIAVAAGEIALGLTAVFAPRRAAPFCVILHLGILLSLLMRNHNASVLPWNLASAIAGFWILRQETPPLNAWWRWSVAGALLVVPAGFYLNLVNPHLAFVLYSGNLPRAYRTTDTHLKKLDGWTGLSVPFPDSPRLFVQMFRRTAEKGDKLFIGDPRWGIPDRYLVMGDEGAVAEITREQFLHAQPGEVAGIEVAHPSAAWHVLRRGAALEYDEGQFVHSAVMDGPHFTDAALHDVGQLPNLRELTIEDATIADAGLAHLHKLSRLEILRITRCGITDDGLSRLEGMDSLTGLHLEETAVTTQGLKILEKLPQLTVLHLPSTRTDDQSLELIGRLTQLTWLDLRGTKITSDGVSKLAALDRCTWINLAHTSVDDRGLKELMQLPNLEVVELAGAKISDAGLAYLSELSLCEHLDLEGTSISDAGLEHLSAMPKLAFLNLRGTRITGPGVRRLQERLPECRIVR